MSEETKSLESYEREALETILARAAIGKLAVESVRRDREWRNSSWNDCELYEADDPEVGGGQPACPFYPIERAIPRSDWCPRCWETDELRSAARRARRRLRDAVARYERLTQ